jgi:hypothetical protein
MTAGATAAYSSAERIQSSFSDEDFFSTALTVLGSAFF